MSLGFASVGIVSSKHAQGMEVNAGDFSVYISINRLLEAEILEEYKPNFVVKILFPLNMKVSDVIKQH
jgi:hypothetical protein